MGCRDINPHNWRNFIHEQSLAFYIVLAILFCLVLYALSQWPGKTSYSSPTSSPEESAWTACTTFVEKQLGVSASDAQKYNPSGVALLVEDNYQVDVYYVKMNVFYRCTIKNKPNGNRQLISLKVK
jgi:hypothetical protein